MTYSPLRYFVMVTATLFFTAAVLLVIRETRIGLCTTIYIAEVLALNQLTRHAEIRVRSRLARMDAILLACFFAVAAIELCNILPTPWA